MDIDAYVEAHRGSWGRLDQLAKSSAKLSGPELDELVDLYQRAATHLSVVRTASPDPILVSNLTGLVARARAAVTGRRTFSWRLIPEFFLRTFPAAAWRVRRWWLGVGVSTLVISAAATAWLANSPYARSHLLSADDRASLEHEFVSYYSASSHSSFFAEVWTHNAFISAVSLMFGFLLGIPAVVFIVETGFQVGIPAGYLIAEGKAGEFFTYILPHGMLELTAVFLAMGAGLRIGWTVIDPGPRSRRRALAEEGRPTLVLALGVTFMLLCSGLIEGFITPSTIIDPWLKVAIGGVVWVAFLTYLSVLGRRAIAGGHTGDVTLDLRGDVLPEAA